MAFEMRQVVAWTMAAATACSIGVVAASNPLTSIWKAPGEGPMDFVGKKVVGLVITDDMDLRMSAEEALAREITARGPQGVAAYRTIPREEIKDAEKAKGWFERTGVAGVVALRIVGQEQRTVYSSAVWVGSSYSSLYDYYGYGWATVTPIGKGRVSTTLAVETLLFRVSDAKLLWAAVSQTTDPKSVAAFMKDLAKTVVGQLEKDGLRSKPSK